MILPQQKQIHSFLTDLGIQSNSMFTLPFQKTHQNWIPVHEARKQIWEKMRAYLCRCCSYDIRNVISNYEARQILARDEEMYPSKIKIPMIRPCSRDYFRIDENFNGSLSFTEIGNYLIHRHCKEVSLVNQNITKERKEYYLNFCQFKNVINDAFQFIGLQFNQGVMRDIFVAADVHKEERISYSLFYQFVNQGFCQLETEAPNYSYDFVNRCLQNPEVLSVSKKKLVDY